MKHEEIKVTIQSYNRSVYALSGTKVMEVASRAGLTLNTACGGIGTCGKCSVRFVQGCPLPNETDRALFSQDDLEAGWRLGCQAEILQECTLHIPEESLLNEKLHILHETTDKTQEIKPAVTKQYVELPEPNIEDDTPYLKRLDDAVGPKDISLNLIRKLPNILRTYGFKGTAVLNNDELINFEQGDSRRQAYGIAVDIGTTTIVASLLHLNSGEEQHIVSDANPQSRYGEDVIARIKHGASSAQGLDELQSTLIGRLSEMFRKLLAETYVNEEHVYEVVVTGNTAMEHLLCGIDPKSLGELPFVPVLCRGLTIPGHELDMPMNSQGYVYLFPTIGGFVGGDTVAGLLASEFAQQESPALFVDLGTNGEIVLLHNGQLKAASTAAGPAFEGARLTCGMRATRGAIEKVVIDDDDLTCSVIGNTTPKGICGSGLIDLVSELLRYGIVSEEGRILPPDEIPETVPRMLRRRVCLDDHGQPRINVDQPFSQGQKPSAVLSQWDIRELQLAAGAVRSGITTLLHQTGIKPSELQKVFVAGGFGTFVRRKHAQRIGLLPHNIEHHRILSIGNAALSGAKETLVSRNARGRAEKYAKQTGHVELALDPEFQNAFVDAMTFPPVTEYQPA